MQFDNNHIDIISENILYNIFNKIYILKLVKTYETLSYN